MKVNAVICPQCGQTIYSRATHDYNTCDAPCGKTAIDGGFEYVKVGYFDSKKTPKTIQIEVKASKQELYDDWNQRINKYGKISPKEEKTKRVPGSNPPISSKGKSRRGINTAARDCQ